MMFVLAAGVVVLILTALAFMSMLPRGGRTHRLVDTEWEPYVAVAFTAAVALGLTMTLSGTLNLVGSQ